MSRWTLKAELAEKELPELLRQLAGTLEADARPPADDPRLAGFPGEVRGFDLAAERCGAGWAVSLRAAARDHDVAAPEGVASAERDADAFERAREKYRQLKKSMQEDYKELRRAAQDGRTPQADALESFLALCEAMTDTVQPLLRARGAEAAELARANQAFLDDARTLRAAARDPEAMAEALARLERRRSACHAQFR